MLVREKGKKDAVPFGMGWDEAQAAIAAGTHEPVDEGGSAKTAETASSDPSDEDLDGMTRAELDAIAFERGIDTAGAANKAAVIEAIRAKR